MPVKKTVTLQFTFDRETKNTVRFDEDSEEPIIGKLYVKKSALGDMKDPKNLVVTIAPA